VQQTDVATVANHQQQIEDLKSMHQRKIREMEVSCKEMESSCKQHMEELTRTHERAFEQARAEQLIQTEQDAEIIWRQRVETLVITCQAAFEKLALEKHDPTYQYNRFRVVELTQLVCRNLADPPAVIDRNRVYNCVKGCMDDLRADYNDNPDNLSGDVRMLLSVCMSSWWFSERQRANIDQ